MKKLHNSLIKRIVASALSLIMVIALFPKTVAFAAETVNPDNTTSSNTLMQLDGQTPVGFDADTTLHPYGNAKERDFLMAEESELYLMQSWDCQYLPDKTKSANSMQYYDTFKDITGTSIGGNLLDIESTAKYASTGTNYPNPYSYMETVAFDPTGTGRRDHIAFVCYRGDNQLGVESRGIYVWVMNTVSGKSSTSKKLAQANWRRQTG